MRRAPFLSLLALCSLLRTGGGLSAQTDGPTKVELPAGVVAEVNGVRLSTDAYREWLLARYGWDHLDEYVTLELLRQRAKALHVEISDLDLEKALDDEYRDQLLLRFNGNEEEYAADLAAAGMTKESRRHRVREKVERELLAGRVVLAEREPTEEILRELYKTEFPGGLRRHLQLAWFDRLSGTPQQMTAAELFNATQRARKRAMAFHEAVAANPGSFAQRARSDSDPLRIPRGDGFVRDLRDAGGDLPRLPKDDLLVGLSTALGERTLANDTLLEPIDLDNGSYVVRVVECGEVSFEEVKDELVEYFLHRSPTPQEMYVLLERLRGEARVVRNASFR